MNKVISFFAIGVIIAITACTTTQTVYQNRAVKACSSPPEGVMVTVTDVSADVALTNAIQQFTAEFRPPPAVVKLIGIKQTNLCEEKDGQLSVSAGVLVEKAIDYANSLNKHIKDAPKGEVLDFKSFATLLKLRNEIRAYVSIRAFFATQGKELPNVNPGTFNAWFDDTVSKGFPIKIYFNNDSSDYLADVVTAAFGDIGLRVLDGDEVEQIAAKFNVYSTPITGGTFKFNRLDVKLTLVAKDGRQLGAFEWNVKGGGNSAETANRDAAIQLKKKIVDDLMITPFEGSNHVD